MQNTSIYDRLSETDRRKILTLLSFLAVMTIASAALIIFLSQQQEQEQQKTPSISGYITIISESGEYRLEIETRDNYDRYEVENNAGTFHYNGKTYQTHRVTLWREQTKVSFNNVIIYFLSEW